MRLVLGHHLMMLRSQDTPKETLDELERLLRRYGGDPAKLDGGHRSGAADGSWGSTE